MKPDRSRAPAHDEEPVCASCAGLTDLVAADESGDTYFCDDCRRIMLSDDVHDPYVDIGPAD